MRSFSLNLAAVKPPVAHLLLLLVVSSLSAAGQTGGISAVPAPPSSPPGQIEPSTGLKQADELKQELDVDAALLSKIPADPLVQPDPLAPILRPVDNLSERLARSARLKFGATYTFLNQYAAIVPEGVRHNQFSGRLDFTGAWAVYDHGSTAGSISLLVRSGTNIGISQQFNLSDRIGSGLYLNCLQGGGPQEPITVNILYWRQDFLSKRLSFYAGKIHPNEYVTLSMFNNDERTQFLNGANDGNLAVASDGTYAGAGLWNTRLLAMYTSTRSRWIRRAHSREASRRWSIENIWRALKWAGLRVHWVKSTGIIASVCGETTPGRMGADLAADLDSSTSFRAGGHPLEDLPRVPSAGPPPSKSRESVWLGCIHSDAGEICSGRHSTIVSRAAQVSIMKVFSSRFIAFV
jgi:hypothetical protein